MATSGEITAIVTVIGTLLGFLGVSIDLAVLQNGVAGILAFLVLLSALWTAWKHHQVVQAGQ
jgi:hypothetical protein